MKSKNNYMYLLILALLSLPFIVLSYNASDAKITGNCANCHTMHNSQNGAPMATYGADGKPWKGSGPYGALTRGTCLGCHGMGTSNKIVTIGGSDIPQVYHTDASGDLAGGNFAYITGVKSRVTADQNSAGHNVVALGQNETVLTTPPGGISSSGGSHPSNVTNANLRCAGKFGCHGKHVDQTKTELQQLIGAHHQNVDGKCDTANENYNSYRFLRGVKGLENTGTYKWQNYNADNHNEYYGASTPMSASACTECHFFSDADVQPTNHTISGFCGTCHGNFHVLSGIGGDTLSPFTRHPTDVILPASGEYSAYTSYSVEAPVARTTVPNSASNTVTPGTDRCCNVSLMPCSPCNAVCGSP